MIKFRAVKADIENALYKIYSGDAGFKQIEVLSFREGSVNALFKVEYMFDNENLEAPLDFAERVLTTMYDNAEFLTQQHIPPAKVHLTEIVVSSYEDLTPTMKPTTERPVEEKNDFLAPILQLPSFRTLFEKVASFVGKTKDDIMQLFTGRDDEVIEEQMTECQRKRDEMTNSAVGQSYWKPQCNAEGDFEAEQCNASVCWCVNTKTGQNVHNSMKRVGADLNCELINMTNEIQVEFNRLETTQRPTTATTQADKCTDLDLCHVVFRNGDLSPCNHHSDFMKLCPRSCDPSCKPAEKPCEDIFEKCSDFQSYCGVDAMIDSGCPVTCGKCGVKIVHKDECVDRYSSCRSWANECHSPSVLASCPKTCQACEDMTDFNQIETSFVEHLESRDEQPQLPIKIENPVSALEHLSSFINSFTSSFAEKEPEESVSPVEVVETSDDVSFGCADIDPRCDTYTNFCHQDNIRLLCPSTCQVDGCTTTTTSTTSTSTQITTKTTTSKPNNFTDISSGDGSGDFEVEFGSGDEIGSGEIESIPAVQDTILVGTAGTVELAAARHQCEVANQQDIRVEVEGRDQTHLIYFADDFFAQSDCSFVLNRHNDDVIVLDVNIIDVRTTQNCDHYMDVYSDDTPIGRKLSSVPLSIFILARLCGNGKHTSVAGKNLHFKVNGYFGFSFQATVSVMAANHFTQLINTKAAGLYRTVHNTINEREYCEDFDQNCPLMKSACHDDIVKSNCPVTCGLCAPLETVRKLIKNYTLIFIKEIVGGCRDKLEQCSLMLGQCGLPTIRENCSRSCGYCQPATFNGIKIDLNKVS